MESGRDIRSKYSQAFAIKIGFQIFMSIILVSITVHLSLKGFSALGALEAELKPLIKWCIGLLGISIVLGGVVTYWWNKFLCWLFVNSGPPFLRERSVKEILLSFTPKRPFNKTGAITGIFERSFFTVAVALGLSGTVVAMIAWIAMKNSNLWREPQFKPSQKYACILSSISSLLIAILGAFVCGIGKGPHLLDSLIGLLN